MRLKRNHGYFVIAGLTVLLIVPSLNCFADFRLPILFPVEKEVVVNELVSEDLLSRLSKIDNLSLVIYMRDGNMMRDALLDRLERTMRGVKKKIVLSGKVNLVHIEQLRKLDRLEVAWRSHGQKMDNETFRSLYELGPVRKYVEISPGMKASELAPLERLKFYTPVVVLGNKPIEENIFHWLENSNHKRPCFVLPADFPAEYVYDLCKFKAVCLEQLTSKNTVPTKLLNVLKDLRGVDVTFVVDGRLSLENVRALAALERFSLKIQLDNNPDYTPGLVKMLNMIAPPSMVPAKR